MEGKKDCSTCRWGKATADSEPCSVCDGYEFDKWEPDVKTGEGEDGTVSGDEAKACLEAAGLIPTNEEREAALRIRAKLGFEGKPVYQQRIEARIDAQVRKGREKYGVTLDENVTLTEAQRIEHLEEELIDALMYCEHLAALGEERGITADDYQRAALRTAQADRLTADELLLNGVMGLCGEAGECIDLVKKARFQGHELDREKLKLELGDVAWYLAVCAKGAGFSLSEVFEANVEKLKARYPDGFDKARSLARPNS